MKSLNLQYDLCLGFSVFSIFISERRTLVARGEVIIRETSSPALQRLCQPLSPGQTRTTGPLRDHSESITRYGMEVKPVESGLIDSLFQTVLGPGTPFSYYEALFSTKRTTPPRAIGTFFPLRTFNHRKNFILGLKFKQKIGTVPIALEFLVVLNIICI